VETRGAMRLIWQRHNLRSSGENDTERCIYARRLFRGSGGGNRSGVVHPSWNSVATFTIFSSAEGARCRFPRMFVAALSARRARVEAETVRCRAEYAPA